jgi:hypothetical protein
MKIALMNDKAKAWLSKILDVLQYQNDKSELCDKIFALALQHTVLDILEKLPKNKLEEFASSVQDGFITEDTYARITEELGEGTVQITFNTRIQMVIKSIFAPVCQKLTEVQKREVLQMLETNSSIN